MASNGPKLKSPTSKNKTEITFESLKEDLDCPVCYDVPESLPIYQCTQGHIICNSCYPKLNNCPVCRVNLKSKIRALIAEKILQKHRDVPYNQSISSDQGQRRRQAGQPAEHGSNIFFSLFLTAILTGPAIAIAIAMCAVTLHSDANWFWNLDNF